MKQFNALHSQWESFPLDQSFKVQDQHPEVKLQLNHIHSHSHGYFHAISGLKHDWKESRLFDLGAKYCFVDTGYFNVPATNVERYESTCYPLGSLWKWGTESFGAILVNVTCKPKPHIAYNLSLFFFSFFFSKKKLSTVMILQRV